MWIEWKYNDHGHPDFKELEVPDDVVACYGSVEDYICELGLVPTWSERFLKERIKWRKLAAPKAETIRSLIAEHTAGIAWRQKKIKELKLLLGLFCMLCGILAHAQSFTLSQELTPSGTLKLTVNNPETNVLALESSLTLASWETVAYVTNTFYQIMDVQAATRVPTSLFYRLRDIGSVTNMQPPWDFFYLSEYNAGRYGSNGVRVFNLDSNILDISIRRWTTNDLPLSNSNPEHAFVQWNIFYAPISGYNSPPTAESIADGSFLANGMTHSQITIVFRTETTNSYRVMWKPIHLSDPISTPSFSVGTGWGYISDYITPTNNITTFKSGLIEYVMFLKLARF